MEHSLNGRVLDIKSAVAKEEIPENDTLLTRTESNTLSNNLKITKKSSARDRKKSNNYYRSKQSYDNSGHGDWLQMRDFNQNGGMYDHDSYTGKYMQKEKLQRINSFNDNMYSSNNKYNNNYQGQMKHNPMMNMSMQMNNNSMYFNHHNGVNNLNNSAYFQQTKMTHSQSMYVNHPNHFPNNMQQMPQTKAPPGMNPMSIQQQQALYFIQNDNNIYNQMNNDPRKLSCNQNIDVNMFNRDSMNNFNNDNGPQMFRQTSLKAKKTISGTFDPNAVEFYPDSINQHKVSRTESFKKTQETFMATGYNNTSKNIKAQENNHMSESPNKNRFLLLDPEIKESLISTNVNENLDISR